MNTSVMVISESQADSDEVNSSSRSFEAIAGSNDEKLSLRGRQMQEFLLGCGVKERSMAGLVGNVLEINTYTARRKLKGETDFSDRELSLLFDWAGYEYLGIHGLRKRETKASEPKELEDGPIYGKDYVDSEMSIEGEKKQCRVWLKVNAEIPAAKGLFIVETNDGKYKVVSDKNVQLGTKPHLIERIEFIEPWIYEGSGATLAIYNEGEAEEVATIAESFRKSGFKTRGISQRDDLGKALSKEKFEAFLIEWVSWHDWNGIEVAESIRQSNQTAPIVLVVGMGESREDHLIEACERLSLKIIEQPAKTQKISESILKEIRLSKLRR
jgi:BetR domain